MQAARVLPALAVLLAPALGGCLGGEDTMPQEGAPAVNETASAQPAVDDGTMEMEADLGHMPHLHDYWLGKDRVTIMDDDVDANEFETLFLTFVNVFRGTPGVGGAFFRLPEGALVYEGTGKMEITPSWSDPTVTGGALRYRTPAGESFSQPVALTSGTPFSLDITPEMTDMPHDKESRWIFWLAPGTPGQAIAGPVHFKIDIVRVRDIELFPGHPELFKGAHTLTLYEGAARSTSRNFATRIVGFMTDNEEESGVRSSAVVPMETLSMTANVTIKSATSNVGEVSRVDFLYKPAGSFRMFPAQVLESDPEQGVYQFGWPVDMRQTDSPYAKSSQWTFDLSIRTEAADRLPVQGLADAEVEYDLTIVAYDSLLDGIDVSGVDERGGA